MWLKNATHILPTYSMDMEILWCPIPIYGTTRTTPGELRCVLILKHLVVGWFHPMTGPNIDPTLKHSEYSPYQKICFACWMCQEFQTKLEHLGILIIIRVFGFWNLPEE